MIVWTSWVTLSPSAAAAGRGTRPPPLRLSVVTSTTPASGSRSCRSSPRPPAGRSPRSRSATGRGGTPAPARPSRPTRACRGWCPPSSVQPVGERLLVVDRPDALDRRLQDLRRRVGVGRVLGRIGVVLRPVRLQELLVSGRRGVDVVADRVEDALGVLDADRVSRTDRRTTGVDAWNICFGLYPTLISARIEVDAVLEAGRALCDHVRLLRRDRRGDRVEVDGLRRVDLAVDGLHARGLELLWMPSATGPPNGSSAITYAAVFGFWSAGRFVTQSAKRSAWCGAVACWAKNRYWNPRLNISGEPPAGST